MTDTVWHSGDSNESPRKTDPAFGPTLQTVIDALARVPSLPAKKRADLTSAIYVFARAVSRQPSEIPAQIDVVERLGRDLNAARLGITQGRLANVKSLVRRAMNLTGHTEVSPRLDFPLDPIWDQLANLPGNPRSRILLRRLFRIFQLKGIAPSALCPAAFQAVRDYLRLSGTDRPDAKYRELVIEWNRLNALLRPYRT